MPHSFYDAKDMDGSPSPFDLSDPLGLGLFEADFDGDRVAAAMFEEYIDNDYLGEACGVDFSDNPGRRLPSSFERWVPSQVAPGHPIQPCLMAHDTSIDIDTPIDVNTQLNIDMSMDTEIPVVNDIPMTNDTPVANSSSSAKSSDTVPSLSTSKPRCTPPTPPKLSPRTPRDEPALLPPVIVTDPSPTFPALAAEPVPTTYNMVMYNHVYGRPLYQHMPPQFLPAGQGYTPDGRPMPQIYPAHTMFVSFSPTGPIFSRSPIYHMGATPMPQRASPPSFQPSFQPQYHSAKVESVSNKRTFQFVEPTVPGQAFAANPHNHGRFEIDGAGNRTYLNAPKAKRLRTR